MSGTAVDIAPGDLLLPGYRAVALLAHGRRMDTWDAIDEARDCRCVVKMARSDRAHEPEVRAAVLQEGRIVCELSHPHLVRGFAVVDGPVPAMVLETLRGATLAAVVEDAPLDVPDLAVLGLQLCSVLGWLHHHDWLHLDLKPSNVIAEHGKAVLIDLSLAARPGDGRPGAGTAGYLAPEQAVGRGLSTATDVWGLGITLLESITGELAYGEDPRWRRGGVLSRRPPTAVHRRMVAALPADLPTDLRELLLACVDLDPTARPRLVDVRRVLTPLAPPEPPPLPPED